MQTRKTQESGISKTSPTPCTNLQLLTEQEFRHLIGESAYKVLVGLALIRMLSTDLSEDTFTPKAKNGEFQPFDALDLALASKGKRGYGCIVRPYGIMDLSLGDGD
jgi:hypothetical protein